MHTLWETETSPSSSSADNSLCEDNTDLMVPLTPTQLLSMAIKKRRSLYDSKDRDFRRELLHTGMIQTLCKYLGEGRALRKNKQRGSKRKHRSSSPTSQTISQNLPKAYAISNEQLETNKISEERAREPTMLELNGMSMDEDADAVVPVMKRPKYEQVFETDTEPTEHEKELIKEYVFEDIFSSLVSFYPTNEYYTVEPTKDLYWCCLDDKDTDTDYWSLESFMPNPPDIDLMATCF